MPGGSDLYKSLITGEGEVARRPVCEEVDPQQRKRSWRDKSKRKRKASTPEDTAGHTATDGSSIGERVKREGREGNGESERGALDSTRSSMVVPVLESATTAPGGRADGSVVRGGATGGKSTGKKRRKTHHDNVGSGAVSRTDTTKISISDIEVAKQALVLQALQSKARLSFIRISKYVRTLSVKRRALLGLRLLSADFIHSLNRHPLHVETEGGLQSVGPSYIGGVSEANATLASVCDSSSYVHLLQQQYPHATPHECTSDADSVAVTATSGAVIPLNGTMGVPSAAEVNRQIDKRARLKVLVTPPLGRANTMPKHGDFHTSIGTASCVSADGTSTGTGWCMLCYI